ncbi:multidrug DMT transporter permease [Asticcacaulis sp. AC460]|uniref:DMT family transporter n=1 Tax=Asticcacaulis sp. AC460 TaxID=1282360 RepID=UPI0003C3C244|nr:DMT family transporter [Asticcacaulis sp. AC460]ESQ87616.1 multidrug DMT transporter permease [Asticcacaulis sp. AC460]
MLSKASSTTLGILCGMGAGALWGLVFLAPELAQDFSPLLLTIGRYIAYGVISVLLIAPRWQVLRAAMTGREWLALAWLALAGNTLYYIFLSSAVQMGGIAMTSLVIGFLPVAVTLIGSRAHGAVPLMRLLPSLLCCAAGAVCIGWQALAVPAQSPITQLVGLLCAVGALVSWTIYAVGNRHWLEKLGAVSAQDWNLLTGVVTGAQALLLIPVALVLDHTHHDAAAWMRFAGVSIGVAVVASIVGNALWNRMSRLLPLTLVGQMILFETLFALIYGFVWEQRWPTVLEAAAFVLICVGVISCISAHRTQVEPH